MLLRVVGSCCAKFETYSQMDAATPNNNVEIFGQQINVVSTNRQYQLVYSISLLKQVRFLTTEQDLSLATHFTLSSLEPIKCMAFSQESVPKFGTLFLNRLKYLNVRSFVKNKGIITKFPAVRRESEESLPSY